MRTYGALAFAVLVIGAFLTSYAASASPSQHAPARDFDERGRNRVLTTPSTAMGSTGDALSALGPAAHRRSGVRQAG